MAIAFGGFCVFFFILDEQDKDLADSKASNTIGQAGVIIDVDVTLSNKRMG